MISSNNFRSAVSLMERDRLGSYPDEEAPVLCPECGAEAEQLYYIKEDLTVIGCNECVGVDEV